MRTSNPLATLLKPCLPLLLLAAQSVDAFYRLDGTDDSPIVCTSFEDCCLACGDDSQRCARGPASTLYLTRAFFSLSVPTEDVGFWDVVFSFYGMVPYLVLIFMLLDLILIKRSWRRILTPLFALPCSLINTMFVKIVGSCEKCLRPCGSIVGMYGLPSGHAANSLGLCLWLLLEIWLGFGTMYSKRTQALLTACYLLLFVPVPYSRYYVGDHTTEQLLLGACVGICVAVLYFFFVRYVIARRLDRMTAKIESWRFHIHIANDFTTRQGLEMSNRTSSSSESIVGNALPLTPKEGDDMNRVFEPQLMITPKELKQLDSAYV